MKESVIKELFGEAISYAEKMRVEDEEYYSQLEVVEIKEKELKEGLTENQLEIFEAFLDAEQRSDSIYCDEAFRQGICFGVRFIIEALQIYEE